MNKITDEGKALLSRLSSGKLVFTKALFDTNHALSVVGSSVNDNLFTLHLRIDNLNLSSNIVYSRIFVYAKIEGDSQDVIYAYVDKSSYIPSASSVPEFVEDIDLCFVFSDIDSITIDNVSNVYALNKDLLAKPELFVGIHKPTVINSPYLWYQTFGDDIDFGNSDYDNSNRDDEVLDDDSSTFSGEVILALLDDELPLNVSINGETKGVDNVQENSPLEFILS